MSGGWRPALRIAWRTARHHRGRTALVAVLVALPVLVGGFLDVVTRTAQLPVEEKVRRFMGAAEAYVEFQGWCGPITAIQYYDHRPSAVEAGSCAVEPKPAPDIPALLPAGTTVVPAHRLTDSFARVRHGERSVRMTLQEQDVTSPLLEGMLRLRSGRWPETIGEIAATPKALERLEASVGDMVTVDRGATVTIVGKYIQPDAVEWDTLIGLPGWTGLPDDPDTLKGSIGPTGDAYLADLLAGTDVLSLQRDLLAEGVVLAPREHVLDPPADQVASFDEGVSVDLQTAGLVVIVVGFGLLEVVLLAGTAFAVSARRQVRDLGLVAATGGEARHVRRIVLAQGLVIGLAGAVVAIPLAVAMVFLGRPWLDRAGGALMGPLDVRLLELVPLVLIGVLAGLAAALVPAFTAARLPVLDALNKRFKSTSLRARWPRAGMAMLIAGIAVSAVGAGLWRNAQIRFNEESERYRTTVDAAGAVAESRQEFVPQLPYPEPPSDTLFLGLMLVGFSLAAVGLAVSSSALVAAVARLGRRLPLSARLALRDAGRHRHRTGPAVAAIMTAVAGSIALSFFVLSNDTQADKNYYWSLRLGQVEVTHMFSDTIEAGTESRLITAVERASEQLPVTSIVSVRFAGGPGADPEDWSYAYAEAVQPGCTDPTRPGGNPAVGIDDGTMLGLRGGVPDEARAALRDGRAVVTSCEYVQDREVTLRVANADGKERVAVPALYLPRSDGLSLPAVVVSPVVAERLGLPTSLSSMVIDTSRVPTRDEEDRAVEVLDRELGQDSAFLRVERGHESQTSVAFLALLGGSAFVTLVGTAIAVALAGAESRADHATLLAVGAEPRRRRILAMGQAATVSVLGVGLGVVLGAIAGSSILGGHENLPFVVPWLTLTEIAIGIPLVGVVIAGVFTRSRLPLDRRIT